MKQLCPSLGDGATSLPLPSRSASPDEALRIFHALFFNRLDRFAVKIGARFEWVIPHDPENLEALLRAHLSQSESNVSYTNTKKGEGGALSKWRVGAPCLSIENTCRWVCIDFDGLGKVQGKEHSAPLIKPLESAISAHSVALSLGLASHLEKSGSATGYHLWIFFEQPIPAIDARRLGRFIVASIPAELRALTGGGAATGLDAKGIEVFPKQTKLTGDGCGNMVWLPCWGNAQPGGARFYKVSTDGVQVELDTILNLTQNNPSAVSTALSQTPEDKQPERRSTEAKQTPRTARTEDFISSGEGWPEWRQKALERLNIEDIYSRYLTGKDHNNGSLECRDFRASDEHPSALVATGSGQMERGSFYSYRDNLTLTIFDFLVESGVVSTIEEAFSWVAKETRIKTPESTPRRYTSQLEATEARAQTEGEALTLDAAGELIRAEAEKAFFEGGLKVFNVSLAGGKTTQVCTVIKGLVSSLKEKQKIAFHVENHDQAREVYATLKSLGVSVRRNFSPVSKEGLLLDVVEIIDGKTTKRSERACKVELPIIEDEFAAGWFGKDTCAKCIFKDGCVARPGFEGEKEAPVIVTTHATPVTDAAFFIVDEQPKLIAEDTIPLDSFDELLQSETIRESQYKALAKEVKTLLSKVKDETDLSIENREEIVRNLESLRNKTSKIKEGRAIVRRVGGMKPVGDKDRKTEGGAIKAARWVLDAALTGNPIYTTTIKGVKSLGFSVITRMGETLKERKSALVLDATASKESLLLLEIISEKKATIVKIAVKDGVQVDRVWLATTATGKDNAIDKHGRPNWQNIKPEIVRVVAELSERPYVKTPLLIWYKQIIEPLRDAIAAQSVDLVGSGEGHNPTKDTKGQTKPNKAQNEALEAFKPLLELIASRGGVLELLHWGKVKGINAHKNADAVLGLGALFAPLEDIRRTRTKAGLPIGEDKEFTSEEFADQLAMAAAEIDQGLGRARVTMANNRERVFLLAMGPALPASFKHGQFEFRHYHQGDGRPRREAPGGVDVVDLVAELQEAKDKAGSGNKLAAILKISTTAMKNYLTGKVVPPLDVMARVKIYNLDQGGHESLLREEEEVFSGVRLSCPPLTPSPSLQSTADCAEDTPSPAELTTNVLEFDSVGAALVASLGEEAEERAAIYQESAGFCREEAEARVLVELGGLSQEEADNITGLTAYRFFDPYFARGSSAQAPG